VLKGKHIGETYESTWDLNLTEGWNIIFGSYFWIDTERRDGTTVTSEKPVDMNLVWEDDYLETEPNPTISTTRGIENRGSVFW
jgi:hypothetical protein